MAQKKKKRPPASAKTTHQATKEFAEKMEPKGKYLVCLSGLMIVASFVINFYSARFFGMAEYNTLQAGSYIGMAIAGAIAAYSTKFNQTKSKINIQSIGIVFVMIGVGNALWLLSSGK